jgi:hypothetical protein
MTKNTLERKQNKINKEGGGFILIFWNNKWVYNFSIINRT